MKVPAQYAKFITAVVGQVVVYLEWKYGSSSTTWLPIVLGAAAALGVYAVPNAQPAPVVTAQPVVPPVPPPVTQKQA